MTITHQECGPFILNRQQYVISPWQFADAFKSDCSPFCQGSRIKKADGLVPSKVVWMLLLSGSQAAESERYAWRLLCLVDSVPLPRSQLRQKPRSCVQALHGMRSLWWVLDGLINPLFIFILSFPLPLMFSPAFFSVAPAFPYVFPLPPLPSYPHPL